MTTSTSTSMTASDDCDGMYGADLSGPAQTGDEIYLELGDYFPPCTLEPIQLICGGTNTVLQELNPAGHCSGPVCQNGTDEWPGYGICYNPTFTVALG